MPKKILSVPEDVDLSTLQQTLEDLREEKEAISWEAPNRAFKTRDKDFWVTAIAILVLVSVIFIFVKEFFLILVGLALLFYGYVVSTVPPERIRNRITNRGVYFGDSFHPWNELSRFWFGKSIDQRALFLETKLRFPPQISMILENVEEAKLKAILLKYLPLMEASPRFVDKASAWLGSKMPLEDRKAP